MKRSKSHFRKPRNYLQNSNMMSFRALCYPSGEGRSFQDEVAQEAINSPAPSVSLGHVTATSNEATGLLRNDLALSGEFITVFQSLKASPMVTDVLRHPTFWDLTFITALL
ncbi:hypothetical protein K7X08_024247 [Anisodus acutangulus]|uniref:Uncharacterized protein n=1 Tax=Anisodus acutangulus TaxID=402998 RepID=A0A9Q1RFH7_9SOLA|nr:hypothetical protein K7X08_024247 [Anisodus acutangulus]